MTVRTLSTIASGVLSASLCMWSAAHAAVTVIGPGPAQACFDSAENGGEPKIGITHCDFALNTSLSDRDRAATFVNRGVLHLRLGENEAALSDINQGLTLEPSLGDAYIDRGAILYVLGRDSDALSDFNKGIELGPRRPHIAYYDRAMVDERGGDVRGAYNDYKKALDIEPGFAPAADELKRFRVVRKDGGV